MFGRKAANIGVELQSYYKFSSDRAADFGIASKKLPKHWNEYEKAAYWAIASVSRLGINAGDLDYMRHCELMVMKRFMDGRIRSEFRSHADELMKDLHRNCGWDNEQKAEEEQPYLNEEEEEEESTDQKILRLMTYKARRRGKAKRTDTRPIEARITNSTNVLIAKLEEEISMADYRRFEETMDDSTRKLLIDEEERASLPPKLNDDIPF